jgi:hypothetical protein
MRPYPVTLDKRRLATPTEASSLVPASGVEWQKISAKAKRPYHFRPKAEPFAFAGIYDVWKGDGGRAITSFSIVTTDAAPSVAQYRSSSRIRRSTRGCAGTTDQAAALIMRSWPQVGNVVAESHGSA